VRSGLIPLAVALLGLGAVACGDATRGAGAGTGASDAAAVSAGAGVAPASPGHLRDDADADGSYATDHVHVGNGADGDDDSYSDTYYDADDENVLDYGHAAEAADARAVTAAVEHYYAIAARGDGAAACRLVTARVARAVPAAYGRSAELPALRGRTCATVMSKVLGELHGQIGADSAALKVGVVRVEGSTAQALLGFGEGGWPSSYTVLRRERGAWRVDELLAGGLP
jgi:hypothetical protein